MTVTAIVDFVCPGQIRELGIRDDLFDVAGSNLHTVAKIEWPGGVQQFAFAAVSCAADDHSGLWQGPIRSRWRSTPSATSRPMV
jgi:hypothetical protein